MFLGQRHPSPRVTFIPTVLLETSIVGKNTINKILSNFGAKLGHLGLIHETLCVCVCCVVASDSLQPHGL